VQRFSTWASWIAAILTAVLFIFKEAVVPVVVGFIKTQPQTNDGIKAALQFLIDVAQQTSFSVVGWILVGLVAGLWLGGRLRKLDDSRADRRKTLGADMVKYGNYLEQYTPWDEQDSAKIKSYFHSAKKSGIWAPDEVNITRDEKLITEYLINVGTMLRDGHFKEAKEAAKESAFSVSKQLIDLAETIS